MSNKINEKKIDVETKKQALAEYLDVEVDEIEDGYDDNHFEVNGDEWMVLTEDESYDEFKEYEMSLIDDLGLEAFAENFQQHILETCIDDSFFDTIVDEESDYYISEMDDEDLLEYAHRHDIAEDIEDVDSEDFDRSDIEDECKYAYQDELNEMGMVEYFESIYGRNWAREMKDTLEKEIDWDAVIDELYNWDTKETLHGSMASYDGKEVELGKYDGEWLFAYWIN